jgi:hypothetical protein
MEVRCRENFQEKACVPSFQTTGLPPRHGNMGRKQGAHILTPRPWCHSPAVYFCKFILKEWAAQPTVATVFLLKETLLEIFLPLT